MIDRERAATGEDSGARREPSREAPAAGFTVGAKPPTATHEHPQGVQGKYTVLTLADLSADVKKIKVKIPSRGVEVELKTFPYAELLAIRAAFTRPSAPVRPNPHKGSLAAPEPDFHDPAYQLEMQEWSRSVRIVSIARAMGFVPGIESKDPKITFDSEHITQWCVAVEEELAGVLSEFDLTTLGNALDMAQGEGEGELDPKAFSSLPAPTLAAVKMLADLLRSPNATA